MKTKKTYNILMYSHDTFGLGHIRRTMAIASHLRSPNTNILILTGSPLAGRFSFPQQIDFVRIPGMIKKTNEEYLPLSIKINPRHALDIRQSIIKATAKTFQPHLFIVDKEPLGLKKEVLPTLKWMRRNQPDTRTVLGLRDIMDDAETVKKSWKKKGIYEILDTLYSEVWTYGIRDFYNPIEEYDIPENISQKMQFTGYIPRKVPNREEVKKEKQRNSIREGQKLVVITTGGGGDGYPVMDAFLSMLESQKRPFPFASILITGPFMPRRKRAKIFKRARKLGILAFHFYRQMEKILAAADLVVCMGGYNTLCELMSQKTVTLLIPRETPRKEQLIRAKCFHRNNLVEYIPWDTLSPETLRQKILHLLEHPEFYQNAIAKFQMTGHKIIRQRLQAFRNREL
ncbi:MAG: glycosyltransferase [Desulfobulbaceae bacterium]|nr:glycosyltransferase [Desulfobulbaceae bacterium]